MKERRSVNAHAISTMLLVVLALLMVIYNIQAARIARLHSQIDMLEEQQMIILEENKRIMAARELVRDPAAIKVIAENQLGYELLTIDRLRYLDLQQ